MKSINFIFKILILLSLITAVFTISLAASAPPARVVDNAELLTIEQKAKLTERLDRLSEELSHDIVVVTVDSTGSKSVELFADDFYDYNGYGYGDTYSGIMLLVSIEDRKYAISTCGDAMDIFGSSELDSLEDSFKSDLSSGDYYNAFSAFADECEYIIEHDNILPPIWIAVSLIIGAIVAGIAIWIMISGHKGVKKQNTANNYMKKESFYLDRSRDVFLYSHVTRVVKPQNNSSGGSRRSSSGRSHGGRSGGF